MTFTIEKWHNDKSKNSYLVTSGNNGRQLLPSNDKFVKEYTNALLEVNKLKTTTQTDVSQLTKKQLLDLIKQM